MFSKNLSAKLILLSVLSTQPALSSAATYFVDASFGKDTNDGLSATQTGNSGPWRSLATLSARPFLPGDTIRLKCGETWHETLALSTSGSQTSAITITSYPEDCAQKPAIDGSTPVPATSWKQYKGNIYTARSPLEWIPNGNFDLGNSSWRTYSPNGDHRLTTTTTDCAPQSTSCIQFYAGASTRNGIISSSRLSIEPKVYTASFSLKAAPGQKIWVVLRRDGSPWDSLGLDQIITGNGTWQTFSINFRGTADTQTARLDFEAQPNSTIKIDSVSLTSPLAAAHQLVSDGTQLQVARHPNPGHNVLRPESPYFIISENSDRLTENGRTGSSFIATGSDFSVPAGISLQNTKIRIRTNAWMMDDRKILSSSGTTITLDRSTSYPLSKGWGFLLLDELWMLDSPSEWHYKSDGNTIFTWMPDGLAPSGKVRIATLDTGVALSGRSNIVVKNLEIKHFRTAINIKNSSGISLIENKIHDTTTDAIDASSSSNALVAGNTIEATGRDAISGFDATTGRFATGMTVSGNIIRDTGVRISNQKVSSTPTRSYAAIRPGTASRVTGNRIINTGYHGIWIMADSEVSGNYIESPCTVLDDCGGIYIRTTDSNSTVTNNVINSVNGAIEGKPFHYSQGQGIFLDDHTSNVIITENKSISADNGIQLHNAYNNTIRENSFFESRKSQIWLQATTNKKNTEGDVFNNRIEFNSIVPLSTSTGVHLETSFSSTLGFAELRENRYYNMITMLVARETINGITTNFNLSEWQSHEELGLARNLDTQSISISPGSSALFKVSSMNMVKNGDMTAGATYWEHWNSTAPFGELKTEPGRDGLVLSYTAGGSLGLVSSSRFSVQKDTIYRMTFDLRSGMDNQATLVGVRRGGGGTNGFEWLMPAPIVYASTSWKRYAITFSASKSITAGDPITGDSGARIDFQVSTPGQQIWIDNVEIVQLAPVGTELRSRVLLNPTEYSIEIDCNDTVGASNFCSRYVSFPDGTSVSWPMLLSSTDAYFVYSQGDTLIDSDADGIGDIQDDCPDTRQNEVVNSKGCGLR